MSDTYLGFVLVITTFQNQALEIIRYYCFKASYTVEREDWEAPK